MTHTQFSRPAPALAFAPRAAGALALAAICAACGGAGSVGTAAGASAAPQAAKVDNRVAEAQLTRVTLSEAAEARLGIQVTEALAGSGARAATIAGEILLPPGQAIIVSAPAAGTIRPAAARLAPGVAVRKGEVLLMLTPLVSAQRDLAVTLDADVQSTRARLDAATQQRDRARTLLAEQAGSRRALELAEQELTQAKALADAAADRQARMKTHPLDADVSMPLLSPAAGIVRQIQVAPGQTVSGGAPLFEVADLRRVWVRVPLYAADLRALRRGAAVEVRDIDGGGPPRRATPVAAPPSADPLALTTDLYFELENPDAALRPGQRVSVLLPASNAPSAGSSASASSSVSAAASARGEAGAARAANGVSAGAAAGSAESAAGAGRSAAGHATSAAAGAGVANTANAASTSSTANPAAHAAAGRDAGLVTVPVSAIVYDAQGGAWLYVRDAPRVYRRQRVDILDVAGQTATIARGLKPGMPIVTVGVAELFGTEFGAGK